MCAEKAQRILMAIVLGFIMLAFAKGAQGDALMFKIAVIAQTFVIIMLLIFAFTNFCPSLWFFEKIFGKCNWDKR